MPDAVLLDVEMPILDGPGMAYQMFVRNCGLENIPIILLSGVVDLEQVAARVGTPYFLGKPYALGSVQALCDRALVERTPPVPARDGPLRGAPALKGS
jgi:FixJ family two-component response regulator